MRHEYFEFLNKTVKHGQGDSDKHLLTLYSIALQISAKSILELGVRGGQTTLPFLCAAAENAGTVHSVDIQYLLILFVRLILLCIGSFISVMLFSGYMM